VRVALLAPMPLELRPLVRMLRLARAGPAGERFQTGRIGRVQVVATSTGIGTRAAARAAAHVLDSGGVDRIVVVGIAGGIGPRVEVGSLVVPERVLDLASGRSHRPAGLGEAAPRGTLVTSDHLLVDPEEIAGLERRGALAIDMETAAVARVCEERGCPWSVFRAISDRAGDPAIDPTVLGLAGSEGDARPAALARFLLTRPWRLPLLARLARDSRIAARRAAAAAASALAQL
jgi:adenosylhomocysteine nucleosidase